MIKLFIYSNDKDPDRRLKVQSKFIIVIFFLFQREIMELIIIRMFMMLGHGALTRKEHTVPYVCILVASFYFIRFCCSGPVG